MQDIQGRQTIARLIKNFKRRGEMEKMFSSIMAGFMKGMSEDDRKEMLACGGG
jgi:hypothetical protein